MNIYGVRGYPTPDATTESICRTFTIPNSTLALGAIMGALLPLTDASAWQKYGDMTEQEAADMLRDIIWAVMTPDMNVCRMIETPYWDTPADANASVVVGSEQTWYGVLFGEDTWSEQIEDWIIAGFLVYAGAPAAAIQFLTIAPRFRLLFKQGDLLGIVRVFINDVLAWQGDTSVASVSGLIHVDIFADKIDPEASEYRLWVEQYGDAQIQVIRKELSPDEVYDPRYRYVMETNAIQFYNGTDWVAAPEADPRSAASGALPPLPADDARCLAASNAARWINDVIDGFLNNAALFSDATGLLGIIATFFLDLGVFGVLIDVILALCVLMFTAGVDAVSAVFTPELYDQIKCIFYCNFSDDGSLTPDGFSRIQSQVTSDIGGLAADILNAMFAITGYVGLNNAGTRDGGEAVDCSSCGSCIEYFCIDMPSPLQGITPETTTCDGAQNTWFYQFQLALNDVGTSDVFQIDRVTMQVNTSGCGSGGGHTIAYGNSNCSPDAFATGYDCEAGLHTYVWDDLNWHGHVNRLMFFASVSDNFSHSGGNVLQVTHIRVEGHSITALPSLLSNYDGYTC